MNKFAILILCTLLFSGCASVQQSNEPSPYEQYIAQNQLQSTQRITAFKFRGWRSLDSEHLIISTSPNRRYLLTLTHSCFDLKHAQGIAVNNRGTSALRAGIDSISVPKYSDTPCFIKAIYTLSKAQADEMAALGKKTAKNTNEA